MTTALLQSFGFSYTTSSSSSSSTHGLSGSLLLLALLLVGVIAIVSISGMWKMFRKAGRPGWAAIIPIYSNWVLFEISGKPGWWALSILLGFIPFVGGLVYFVLYILAMLELAKRFGKSSVFAVFGMIIFSVIGFLILGYGKAEYHAISTDGPQPPAVPPAPSQPTPPPVSPA